MEGAANEEVIEVLAQWLGVPRRTVELVRGRGGRDKVVELVTPEPMALAVRIEKLLAAFVDNPGAGG